MIITYILLAVACIFIAGWVFSLSDSILVGVISLVVSAIILIGGFTWYLNATAAGERMVKSHNSNYQGGLNRTVEVYDYNGGLIKKYEGKIDMKEGDSGERLFDLNDKRTTIDGGIIITQEK